MQAQTIIVLQGLVWPFVSLLGDTLLDPNSLCVVNYQYIDETQNLLALLHASSTVHGEWCTPHVHRRLRRLLLQRLRLLRWGGYCTWLGGVVPPTTPQMGTSSTRLRTCLLHLRGSGAPHNDINGKLIAPMWEWCPHGSPTQLRTPPSTSSPWVLVHLGA